MPGTPPGEPVILPRSGGGEVRLGPERSARLTLFFATWDRQVMDLGAHLETLDRYQASAATAGLPPLTAVDEGSVEPSPAALPAFLRGLRPGLRYPVAIDRTGRLADGYEVQDEPWFVLTTSAGRIIWYWDVSTAGWPSGRALAAHVRAALARAPAAASSPSDVQRELAGSPTPLADLHQQASELLGAEPALAQRLRSLRGYPVVVNAWASWCTPCRSEFSLFASASARYGRRVAFLGADTSDSAGDARSFLAQHRVSYPSYQVSTTGLHLLLPGGLQGLPTTIYIGPTGKVVYIHTGQYQAQGSLNADLNAYALSR
jgi:thiol-disulfide isomerase/thioredoxin